MPERPLPSKSTEVLCHRWHFAIVFLAALLLAVAQPLASELVDERGSFDLSFSLLIAAVMRLVFEEREHRRIAFSLGLGGFLAIWFSHGVGGVASRMLLVAAYLLAAGFFAFALYGILRAILVKQASGDALFGVICGYLLLGIVWTLLYCAVETARPGSFAKQAQRDVVGVAAGLDRGALSYYSFVTLATVGYGDVTPTTPLARTLAWIEAITGQFYLAILVAGLVGYKVTQAMNE